VRGATFLTDVVADIFGIGFGGTNAHVIVESYEADQSETTHVSNRGIVTLPFTFTAASENSLASCVQSFAKYLEANKSIDLANLAYTLNFRRTAFSFRRSFSATTVDTLLEKLHAATSKPEAVATVTVKPTKSKILGIFTGQGAQWPTMGRELIQNFVFARQIIDMLQNALDSLPIGDRPTWSLMQQLYAEPHESRLATAAISQPLCTVVQVILIDMLRLAGIEFDAVVGHSSGEIGAAYAAGLLSAEDCTKIAYYRGLYATMAGSHSGAKGAMMAVGTSLDDAEQLCELEDLAGRVSVAACNSSSNVTLSGDLDAIEEAETALEDEGKFVRKLNVDTAYHSHHMLPCVELYVRSLETCAIQIQPRSRNSCVWFSSVTGKAIDINDPSLQSTYWCDNMTGRVNFAQAMEAALNSYGTFGIAIEVGPHPALQGPALQTIQDVTGERIPYIGTMQRGKMDIESFADALGFALAYIPEDVLTYRNFADTTMPRTVQTPMKGLPSYAWEHDRIYWQESRWARAFRTREHPVHELLGTLSHDGSLCALRWRNIISPKEVPWLYGHKLQGQIVFPASGYVSMAVEAAMIFAGDRNVRLLTLRDIVMGKAMVFEDERSTADVHFTLVIESSSEHEAEARFHLEGTTNQNSNDMVTFATGMLSIEFGDTDPTVLPPRSAPLIDTVLVDTELFYRSLLSVGYEYSDTFKALTTMRRTANASTGFITQSAHDTDNSSLLVHPGSLDCAIQAIILALCWPGDNRLWSLHVPNKISCIRLNPTLMTGSSIPRVLLPVDASLTSSDSSVISGNVDVYASIGQEAVMQLEGISIVPLSSGTPAMDAELFFDIRWAAAVPDMAVITQEARATHDENELATLCDRVAYYYLRTLMEEVTAEEWSSAAWYFRQLQKFSSHYIDQIQSGRQPRSELAWQYDTQEQIYGAMAKSVQNDNILRYT
jgi:hybrid polyketide synthase/nonribosomal peptide synthetase ACE1